MTDEEIKSEVQKVIEFEKYAVKFIEDFNTKWKKDGTAISFGLNEQNKDKIEFQLWVFLGLADYGFSSDGHKFGDYFKELKQRST